MSRRAMVWALMLCGVGLTAPRALGKKAAAPMVTSEPVRAPADPWAGRSDLFVAPTVSPSAQVDLGAIERFTLQNGLSVIAVPRHQTPVINVAIAVRIDDAAEPLDKSGLADFTTAMLRKGTQRRSSDQIADQIDFAGGELESAVDDGAAVLDCRGRARDLSLCLDLVGDVVANASFPQAEMAEIRDMLFAAIEASRDNPSELAKQHAHNLYFGDDDPRGRVMSKRSIGAIDRAALVAFHRTWFRPNNAVLAISGDFDPKVLRVALGKWFGGWKKGEVPKLVSRALPAPAPLQVRLVDKPDATQSGIVVLGPGIRHADADLCATRLMNYSLGDGVFSSRLMKVVRSENAKTYGAHSTFEARREVGTFSATTFTREAETANTIKLVLGEIERMHTGGPTPGELSAAKANLIGGYGLHFETSSDVARQLVIAAIDLLPADFAITYPRCLESVTLVDATRAAEAHLHPQALVVVGNAKVVAPLLIAAKLAPTETVPYTDPIGAAERKASHGAQDQAK